MAEKGDTPAKGAGLGRPLIIILIVVAALVIAVAVYLALGLGNTGDNAVTEPPETEAPVGSTTETETETGTEAEATTDLETFYYTVSVPESWGDVGFTSYGEERLTIGATGAGCETRVERDGELAFSVVCYSDDFGFQGEAWAERIGSLPRAEGWYVEVTAPRFDENGVELPNRIEEYTSYVKLAPAF
jgi:hypothetical protein